MKSNISREAIKLKNNRELILRDIVICLLLIAAGFIIAQLVGSFDLNWFTLITRESVQFSLSILANLATILGVGIAIYVYKSWHRQQHFIKQDKILDDLYLTFRNLQISSSELATLSKAKFNMYKSYYDNGGSQPPSYKILDLEQYTNERKKAYDSNMDEYNSAFNSLSLISKGIYHYEINSHRICNSFGKINRELNKAIKNFSFKESEKIIDDECNFIREFSGIFCEYHKKISS